MRLIGVKEIIFLLICVVFQMIHATNETVDTRGLFQDVTNLGIETFDSVASTSVEWQLSDFLQKFRSRMREGIPKLGVPVLEPLHEDEIDLSLTNKKMPNMPVVIKDVVVANLSTFTIANGDITAVNRTFTANLTIPDLFIRGAYNVPTIVLGSILKRPVTHPFKMYVYNLTMYVNGTLGHSAEGWYMETFDFDFTIKSVKARFTSIALPKSIDNMLSRGYERYSPKALKVIIPRILPSVRNYIGNFINKTMHHISTDDVLFPSRWYTDSNAEEKVEST